MPQLDCIPPVHPHPHSHHHHNVDGQKEGQPKMIKRKGSKGMCQQTATGDSLTPSQREKVAELRKALGEELLRETALFNDDYSLLRWINGWNNKIDEIVPRFRRASSIFRCMHLNHLVIEDIDDLNDHARRFTSAADFYPGGVLGYDREGNVVSLQWMGQSHPKQLAKCGRVSDVYRLGIRETALIYQLIRIQERKRARKLGLKVIIDLEGFNTDHLSPMALKVYANTLSVMQDLFPDLLRQVFVINAHYLVKTAYNIIKPVLSEQSRDKVVFLDSYFHEVLAKDLGPENLFKRWGGTRVPERGHPEAGTLRIGGVPPVSIRYLSDSNPEHMEEGMLRKLNVPARQRREVEVQVPEPGPHSLHWFFNSNGDVSFGVLTCQDKEVWPMLHLLTDYVPEFGNVPVEGGASYKLVFDNSHGTFFGREIKFGYRLKKAVDDQKVEKENGKLRDGGEARDAEEEKENGLGMEAEKGAERTEKQQ